MVRALTGLAIIVYLMGYFMYSMKQDIRELKKTVILLLEFEIKRNPGFPIKEAALRK
jgi:hypothetical protein